MFYTFFIIDLVQIIITLFSDKSVPLLTFIIITVSFILGGIWVYVGSLNSTMKNDMN